jgi:phage antirepressor YoqD-like protein
MSKVVSSTEKKVIGSREIAKILGKQHAHILRSLRTMASRGAITYIEDTYRGPESGRVMPEYKLDQLNARAAVAWIAPEKIRDIDAYSSGITIKPVAAAVSVVVAPEVRKVSIPQDEVVTMSSLEIHKLTGKAHTNVLRDIRKMLEELEIPELMFESGYLDAQNQQRVCFKLPRREVDILLTGYSTTMRAAVIDRWRELEAEVVKPAFKVPTTLHGALMLAAELEEQRAVLTHQVEAQELKITKDKPKVEFYEEFVESEELQSVGQVAKILGTGPILLFRYLQKHKILIGGTGDNKNMPYQKYLNSGRMDVKYNNHTVPETGEVKIRPKPLFTRKGVDWIREFVKEHGRVGL